MRVAYVCADPGVPVWGNKGCSIHVQEILRALVRKNMDVHLFAVKRGGTCPAGLESVSLYLIDRELPNEAGEREQALFGLNDVVNEMLETTGPFDWIYERYALWSFASLEYAQRAGVAGLLEVNAPLVEEQANYRVLVDREQATEATRRAFRSAAAVLPVSEGVADYVRNYGVPPDRIHVLPNAVNRADYNCRQPPISGDAAGNGTFTIGFVGSLKPWHGVDQLISAYSRLWESESRWQLLIAGDGPDRDRLQALARALPAPIAASIEFLGMVPHAQIPQFLAALNAAVSPCVSSDTYFSPLKLFEYMAAGLPVVAARCGQIPSLIQHGVTGLLYNPGDTGELASGLLRLRAEPLLAAQIGIGAQREVFTHHTWDDRCDSILRLVERPVLSHALVAD
jgi:glycosyltransferase involved in cell wall biosynthesis